MNASVIKLEENHRFNVIVDMGLPSERWVPAAMVDTEHGVVGWHQEMPDGRFRMVKRKVQNIHMGPFDSKQIIPVYERAP